MTRPYNAAMFPQKTYGKRPVPVTLSLRVSSSFLGTQAKKGKEWDLLCVSTAGSGGHAQRGE